MKLGFVCEGKTERKIVESMDFRDLLRSYGHELAGDVIDAKGKGRLLPRSLTGFVTVLRNKGAQRIVILTDLDEDACITLTKERIDKDNEHIIVVAVKAIESWFLADSRLMSSLLRRKFEFPEPEKADGFSTINNLLLEHTGRGCSDKTILVSMALNNGFSVLAAANHPNCASAKYLVRRLQDL